ncbi:MAG: CbiX/SirB N-terminal domain-containing protein, partial [Cyanobacteria bacterium P01_H01_bin.121]
QAEQAKIKLRLQPYLGHYPELRSLLVQALDPTYQWILLAHGSRRAGATAPIEALAQDLGMIPAYWAHPPSLHDAINSLAAAGQTRIGVLPYLLFPGGISDTLTRWSRELEAAHPPLQLKQLGTLSEQPGFFQVLRAALPLQLSTASN